MKKVRTISHWQIHTLSVPTSVIREHRPDVELDKALIVTGTIVEDTSGCFNVGWHCRSTVAIQYDEENGIFETKNTIYKLVDPQGDLFDNMGDNVMEIFY